MSVEENTYRQVHRIKRGDRLFTALNDFLIIISSVALASSLILHAKTHTLDRPQMKLFARRLGCAYALPLRGALDNALYNSIPELIEIGEMTAEHADEPLDGEVKARTRGLNNVMHHIISPIFIIFFERYNIWLTENRGKAETWPPTLNFARVIRNAMAHGSIQIKDPNAPPVQWRSFSYGPADSGKRIVGEDIGIGEILGLMFEVNDALDGLQAPIL
jgi:hypothetical protein